MCALGDWLVECEPPLPNPGPSEREQLRWQDGVTPLKISTVDRDGARVYRLWLSNELSVDVLPDRRIIAHHAPDMPRSTVDHFLSDQIIPRLLANEGSFVVHAGGVRVGESAMMVMGHSGRGKSTLTASFDCAGCALLGDDAMVVSSLSDRPAVRAVYRSLRLFPDSIDALMPKTARAGPVAHFTSKERIDVAIDGEFTDVPLRVLAMFAIAPAAHDPAISVRGMSVAESCMMLVESSFALDPSDTNQARQRMEQASALATAVPAFEISYPRDYARLPEVRQAILEKVAALEPL